MAVKYSTPQKNMGGAGQSLVNLLAGNLLGGATTRQASQASSSSPSSGGASSVPATSPVKTKPNKPAPNKPIGGLNPNSNFGLNINSKVGFDPFAQPATQGAFNKQVLAAAQPDYMPQLQAIQSQIGAENNAAGQRTSDIGSIYDQYQTQAQQAYDKLKSDLAAIQAQVAPGSAEANLGAALASAVGGSNSLATMMGQSTQNPSAAALPYLGASEAQEAATQQLANGAEAGSLGLQAGNLANVGTERATEQNTESLRHQAALTGYGQQKQQLAATIPGIIEKARENLIQQLQSGESLNFQQNLAAKQFGLSVKSEADQTAQNKAQLGETAKVDAANIAQGKAQIDQAGRKLSDDEAATRTATATALAQAQGQAQANGIKYLQSALLPTADAYKEVNIYDQNKNSPTYGQKIGTQKVLTNPKSWHVDVGSVLKTLMTQYGIGQDQALQMMSSLGGRVYISGQGGQTVADWANSFNARDKARGNPAVAGNRALKFLTGF